MRFERTKNSVRNMAYGTLEKIVTILFPFITRTLIIYKLGAEYAGLNALFTSILSVLSVSELGIGSAIIFCLYKPVAEGQKDVVCQLLGLLKKLYRVIGLVIFSVGLLLIPFLPYLVKNDCPPDISITVLYVIYLLNASVSYFLFAYKEALFKVHQRKDIIDKIRMTSVLMKYAFQVVILLVSTNYYLFVLALFISTFFDTVLVGIVSKKQFPDLQPLGTPSKEYKQIIKSKTKYLALNMVSSKLVNSFDKLVLSASLGLTMVAVYENYHYISSSLLAFFLMGFQSITASVGNALVSESEEKNHRLFNTLWNGVSWGIIWCSICLLCLYQPFITLWVGESFLLDTGVVILVVLLFFANGSTQFYSTIYINATGLWNKTVGFRIIAALVNLVLNMLFVKQFQVAGVLVASLVAYFLISLPWHIFVTYKYILHRPVWQGFVGVLRNIAMFVGFGGITYGICAIIPLEGLWAFLIRGIVCIAVPNVICFLLFRKTKVMQEMKGYLKMLRAKR